MLAWLVINEHSRSGRLLADRVRHELRSHGVELVEGGFPGEIAGDLDCIIAAGGDGTVTRLIAPAIAHDLPLGIVPLGTFNELARTLAIPLDPTGACALIGSRRERRIDVGSVNGKYFVNEASIGISARIARLQTPELKQRFGLFGVIGTALQAYRHARPIHARISDDGGDVVRLRTIQLTIANSHRFGGVFSVAGAAIDDGWLDLYSVEINGFREAFGVASAIFAGRPERVDGLFTLRDRAFDVTTAHPHHIMADGEPAGVTPARFEVHPRALRVIAP